MAITIKSNVSGAAWPTSGTPTNTNTGGAVPNGLLIDGGTADAAISQTGAFGAWSTATVRDTQPSQVTSTSYVELSSTGTCFQTVLQASVTDADFDTGVMMDYWIQFKLQSTYAEGDGTNGNGTPPQNLIQEIAEVQDQTSGDGGTADNLFALRINGRNIKGYAPGVLLLCVAQNVSGANLNSSDMPTGGSSSYPAAHLAVDRWYQLKFWMKRSTGAAANDGKLRIWINDVMIFASDVVDAWWAAGTPQRWRFLQALSGWGGWTGVRVRYAAPIRTRVMTEADIEAPVQTLWDTNTSQNYSLRRNWSAMHTGYGTPWTITGALSANVPARGTKYSTGGVYPGRAYLPIALTAGNGVNLAAPAYWSGVAATDPRDSVSGLTHVVFNDFMPAAGSAITGYVYMSDDTTPIVSVQVDATAGTFSVNGDTIYSGLSDSIRWKVWVTIGGGKCTVGLQNQTSTAYSSSSMRCADYAYQGGFTDGSAIGITKIIAVGASPETVHVSGISGYARLDIPLADSYVTADAGSTPALQCEGQRIGQNFNQHSDGTVPGGYDPVPYTGGITGINFAINGALSGEKLSKFYSTVVPHIGSIRGVRWFIFGADVNDIPGSGTITSMALAWAAAETIAETKVNFINWALSRGHKVFITDGWNLRDAGVVFNGAANMYRRKVPGMVHDILKTRIAQLNNVRGNLFYTPTQWAIDGNADSISTDGVHPTAGFDTNIARAMHEAYANVSTVPGWNTDGSIEPTTAEAFSRSDRNG